MRILLVHNEYQQPGGEDAVVSAESEQLQRNGHTVLHYTRHNNEFTGQNGLRIGKAALETVWSNRTFRELSKLLHAEQPDLAHFHNTFPLISPSAYYACAQSRTPVVQTLHNYRLLCPAATFLRNGRVCESCLGGSVPWKGVVHGCYRQNRAATAVVASMLAAHRAARTWQTKVGLYIALSEFARKKFSEGGFPEERLTVKPNFVRSDPGIRAPEVLGDFAFFAGRLAEEKGLRILLHAWKRLNGAIPLLIAGDGPLHDELAAQISQLQLSNVRMLGRKTRDEVFRLLRNARFLVCPSHWYEVAPLVIIEAFACGVPVIASGHGPTVETIANGITGMHVHPGDADDLALRVIWAWAHPREMQEMGRAARREFEAKYTASHNYDRLMTIYRRVMEDRSAVPQPQCAATSLAESESKC